MSHMTTRHPKNGTRFKSLDSVAADPRAREIWSEGEDGIWVTLAYGYCAGDDGLHTVHEWNVRDTVSAFRSVRACDCALCNETDPLATE